MTTILPTRDELAALGSRMRTAQAEYVRTRSDEALERSKRLEREFDVVVAAILDRHGRSPERRTVGDG